MKPIEFFFDFSSPYGYFCSKQIDALAAQFGRTVCWRPYLMGAVMKVTERKPLVQIPMVNEYSLHDLERTARFFQIPFKLPSKFPVATIAPCRAYYWLNQRDSEQAKALAQAMFSAYFVHDELISQPAVVVAIGERNGLDADELSAALADEEVKQLLRTATDNAIEKKIFGSPFVVVDGEKFWGHDRLAQVEKWLETGGW